MSTARMCAKMIRVCGILAALACLTPWCVAGEMPSFVQFLSAPGAPSWNSGVIAASVATPPQVDGLLEDGCWRQAGVVTLRSESGRAEVSRDTRVRVCCDRENLYVAFECYALDLQQYPAATVETDTLPPENVQVRIATGDADKAVFHAAVDPNGASYDLSDRAAEGQAPVWTVRVRRAAQTWYAEFCIPKEALGVNAVPEAGSWRANFHRSVAANAAQFAWIPESIATDGARWGQIRFQPAVKVVRVATPPARTSVPAEEGVVVRREIIVRTEPVLVAPAPVIVVPGRTTYYGPPPPPRYGPRYDGPYLWPWVLPSYRSCDRDGRPRPGVSISTGLVFGHSSKHFGWSVGIGGPTFSIGPDGFHWDP